MLDWESKRFEDCIDRVKYTKKIPKKQFLKSGRFPIVSQERDLINGYWECGSDIFKIQRPVVIFGDHTQVLKYVDFDFVLGADGVKILQPREFIDPKFFLYFLMAFPVANTGYARHYRFLKELTVTFPTSIGEQKHIVAILDEAFDGIAAATANAEKNLQNAHELLESYLQSVFAERGAGWVEKELGELCQTITKGSSPKWQGMKYVETPGILFITSENVGNNKIVLDKRKYVEDAFNDKEKKSKLMKGDVLTNIVGASIGRTAVFDIDEVANINQAVCILRCDPTTLMSSYLSHLLNSPFFKKILHENEVDNARANLSLGFFKSLNIPVPPIFDQHEIAARIDAFSSETQRLEAIYQQKLNEFAVLRQSILQKAFTGELH